MSAPISKEDGIVYETSNLPSRHRYFSSDTQLVNQSVLVLPQRGGITGGTGRPPNSYAIIFDDFSILIDAPFSWCREAIEWLVLSGKRPRRHFLSHRHIPMSADAIREYERRDGKIFLLHPNDQSHDDAAGKAEYADPTCDPVLAETGLEAIHMPGHTAGSVMLYSQLNGGILFAGDCAVGPGPQQANGSPFLQRPIMKQGEQNFCTRFAEIAGSREIATVLPYHGDWYSGRMNMTSLLENVWTGEPMDPSGST